MRLTLMHVDSKHLLSGCRRVKPKVTDVLCLPDRMPSEITTFNDEKIQLLVEWGCGPLSEKRDQFISWTADVLRTTWKDSQKELLRFGLTNKD